MGDVLDFLEFVKRKKKKKKRVKKADAVEVEKYFNTTADNAVDFACDFIDKYHPELFEQQGVNDEILSLVFAAALLGGMEELCKGQALMKAGSTREFQKYAKLIRQLQKKK